ncbi:uncharacterized protein BKA78DRAFT_355615 [Phyllosticta capitalensis]|uniref:uncharacterized protein n=1 Tax=Phyllosticta capitalensis TaxID=121624 RepID=UPI003132136F
MPTQFPMEYPEIIERFLEAELHLNALTMIFCMGYRTDNLAPQAMDESDNPIMMSNTPIYQRPPIEDPEAYGVDPEAMPPSRYKPKETDKRPHSSSEDGPEALETKRLSPTAPDAAPAVEGQLASQGNVNQTDVTAVSNAPASYDASIQVGAHLCIGVKLTKDNAVETLQKIDEYAKWRRSEQGEEVDLSFSEFHRVKEYFQSKA